MSIFQKISLILLIFVCILVFLFFFDSEHSNLNSQAVWISETSDQIRVRHLWLINDAIKKAQKDWVTLPYPENSLEIQFNSLLISFQGTTSDSFYDILGLPTLLDPDTWEYYPYVISGDSLRYQILTFLDSSEKNNLLIGEDIYTYYIGDKWLFSFNNSYDIITPAHAGGQSIDVSLFSTRKKAWIPPLISCQDILSQVPHTKIKSGKYDIDIGGREISVYCDMETDGGGWTLFYANNGHEDSPIQKSYVEMRETMKSKSILDLGNYNNQYLAGLLDYSHFTQSGATEVLIRNRTSPDTKKWVKFIFSSSRALDWALSEGVLWRTTYGCVNLPRRDTWTILNQDKSIFYDKLRQIMNHWGTNWGISHEEYPCNDLGEVAINPHIAFFNALDKKYENRARSNQGVGGAWWAGQEYRYFIR